MCVIVVVYKFSRTFFVLGADDWIKFCMFINTAKLQFSIYDIVCCLLQIIKLCDLN